MRSQQSTANLETQAEQLCAYCAAKGWKVYRVVKEIGSGVNDGRKKRLALLADPTGTIIGIEVKLTEESYTSVASFLDRDKMPKYDPKREKKPKFSGKRIKRGLYRASDGRLINADVQGSYNITRKVAPKAFDVEGVEDGKASTLCSLVVHPRRISFPRRTQKGKS